MDNEIKTTAFKKSIFFIADVRNWAFDNIAQYLKPILKAKYNVTILYTGDFKNPSKLLDELNKFDRIDYIHFFYRGSLQHLLEYIAVNNIPEQKIQKLLSAGITTSIPDHLFIQDTKDILNYQPTFSFVDYYYTISQKLYDIYSNISFYPAPWKKVIFDNVFIEKQTPDFNDNKQLGVTWIGNSAWGEWCFDKGYDAKGYHTVIVPTFAALEKEGINVEKIIVDAAQKKRSKAQIFELLKKTDILLISANTEGTPLPLIEAMSSGCAIITTHSGIAPEVLPKAQQAFIVNKNPEEFIQAIKKLNSDRNLLNQLKQDNFRAYEKIFCNTDDFRERWSGLIENTIDKSTNKNRLNEKKAVIENLKREIPGRGNFFSIKNIISNQAVRKAVKYLFRFKFLKSVVLNLYSILKTKKVGNNLIMFRSALSKTLAISKNGDGLLVLYPSTCPGVVNSTSTLFNQSIALPSYGIFEMIGLHNKAIEQIAKAILKAPIKKLVISGGSRVLFPLVEILQAKKGKQILDIYFLWHGSSAQWSEPHHLEHFNLVCNLYNQNKIQGIITLKKGLEHVLQAYGIKSYLLQNFIIQPYQGIIATPKTDKFRIGIWSAYATWIKNLYPQIIAAKMLKEDLILSTNFNISKDDRWVIEGLETKTFEQQLPHDQLMLAIANTDITLYVTNSECSPMIALESLSLGIPCIVGPTSALYDDDEFLKEILTVNRVDCPVAISNSIQKTIKHYDKIKVEIPKFVAKYNAEANLLKQNFCNKIKIEE